MTVDFEPHELAELLLVGGFDDDRRGKLPILTGLLGAGLGLKLARETEVFNWQLVGALSALGFYAGLGWAYERRADRRPLTEPSARSTHDPSARAPEDT